ncbi:hypothetical protein CRV02_13500 [Arcobacter sp. CECT 8989]|jgi:hypothetical protein|nr:hypothetical protein CRV02_13500 [Arcobacter sp. CECT 8989]
MKKNKLLLFSVNLFTIGIIFLYLETNFYQFVDHNNFLQESWFMPLGLFSLIFGALGLLLVFVKTIWLKIKNN